MRRHGRAAGFGRFWGPETPDGDADADQRAGELVRHAASGFAFDFGCIRDIGRPSADQTGASHSSEQTDARSHLINGRARRSARAKASDFQGKPGFFQSARRRARSGAPYHGNCEKSSNRIVASELIRSTLARAEGCRAIIARQVVSKGHTEADHRADPREPDTEFRGRPGHRPLEAKPRQERGLWSRRLPARRCENC